MRSGCFLNMFPTPLPCKLSLRVCFRIAVVAVATGLPYPTPMSLHSHPPSLCILEATDYPVFTDFSAESSLASELAQPLLGRSFLGSIL